MFRCAKLDPMDCSLPGSSVHGIFQARVLEWVAIAFSKNLRYEFLVNRGFQGVAGQAELVRREVGIGFLAHEHTRYADRHTHHDQAQGRDAAAGPLARRVNHLISMALMSPSFLPRLSFRGKLTKCQRAVVMSSCTASPMG